MGTVDKCDVCGRRLYGHLMHRAEPWEIITCGAFRCHVEAPRLEADRRREWKDQMIQDQGLDNE